MASRLESLPPELLLRVVDCIPRPSDLKALCLTSKAMRPSATTRLYNCLTFDASARGWAGDFSTRVLSETNPGLAQVRRLHVCDSQYDMEETEGMTTVLKMLPKNVLRELDCRHTMVDEDAMLTLLTRQQKLDSLALGTLTFNLMPFLQAGLLDVAAFANVEDLDIPKVIGSHHDLDLYQLIIEKAPLRYLAIRTFSPAPNNDLDDDETRDGLLSSVLFKQVRGVEGAAKIQLHKLELDNIQLTWSDRTFLHYFDWSNLKELVLYDCPGVDVFVEALTQYFKEHGAQLESFHLTPCGNVPLDSSIVEAFLGTFDGLVELSLSEIDNFSVLNLEVLAKHTSTLQWLSLHPDGSGNRGSIDMGMDPRFFSNVIAKCRKLRQVALPLPKINLPRSDAEFDMLRSYKSALVTLLDLPDLRSLRVYNRPLPSEPFIVPRHPGDIAPNVRLYVHDLDSFVLNHLCWVFARKACRLPWPVLCFNGTVRSCVSDGVVELPMRDSVAYVPMKQLDIFGRLGLRMQRANLTDVGYFEPESDILDW